MSDLTLAYVPIGDLEPDPGNPKAHTIDTIVDAILRFGFMDPVVHDGRTGRLIAGHGRREALLTIHADPDVTEIPAGIRAPDGRDGVWEVPVVYGWSSASDDEAAAALVALNETTIRGGYDEWALLGILERLEETSLSGVGYDGEEIDALRMRLETIDAGPVDAQAAWDAAGMPDYEQGDLSGAASVVVHFPTEEDAERFFALIERPRRKTIWWPDADGHKGATISQEWGADA